MPNYLNKKSQLVTSCRHEIQTVKCGCDELACFYKNFYILLNIILVQVWPATTGKAISIPLHGVAVAAALVIFKRVGKRGGITSEREVIRCIRCQHHRAAHVETVKVAAERCRSH